MRIGVLTICFLLAGLLSLDAQKLMVPDHINKRAVKIYEEGLEHVRNKRFDKALLAFTDALEKAPEFLAARIMKASVHFETKDFAEAEKEFLSVIQSGDEVPPKVFYTTGLVQWKLDKFGPAVENFNRYLQYDDLPDILKEKAIRYRDYSLFAKEAVAHPLPFDPQSMDDNINTEVNEYLPSITADGKTMVFTRRVGSSEFLFETRFENGQWSEPRSIDEINKYMESGAHSLSADGKFLVFTSCERQDGYGSCDLYYSALRRGKWTRPRNMGKMINSAAWDSQPSLADNGRTLYFSSNRKGTLGQKDIWVARRNNQGRWTPPVNVGGPINTIGDEKAPFIHFDARTLYFMSNHHKGMGDFDLFMSTLSDEGTWSEPLNLGYPINTKFHDGTFVLDITGKKGFMTSDRHHRKALTKDNRALVETDIYTFEMPEEIAPQPSTFLEIAVVDKMTQEPISAGIKVYRHKTGQFIFRGFADEEGEMLVVLPLGADYAVNVLAEGYAFFSSRVDLTNYSSESPFLLKVELWKPEATIEEPVVLKNVLFESGSAELRESSFEEISELFELLKGQPLIFIEIRGHTDDVGQANDNQILSEARAEKIYNTLIDMGIDKNRLSYVGLGETQPIADNATEAGRRLNRRTEFVILKK